MCVNLQLRRTIFSTCMSFVCLCSQSASSSRVVCTGRTGHPSNAPHHLWPNWPFHRRWSPKWRLSWTGTPQNNGIWSTWKTPFSRTPSLHPRTTKALWSWRWESVYSKLFQHHSSTVSFSLFTFLILQLISGSLSFKLPKSRCQQRSKVRHRSTDLAKYLKKKFFLKSLA